MQDLPSCSPASRLFRIGRIPDPWQEPDWSRAGDDKTFGNRFDDPKGKYRVLYASTQRLACFVECLAPFRPDIALLSALAAIQGPDALPLFDIEDWVKKRAIGSALVKGRFADIYSSGWVNYLQTALATTAASMGMVELDLSNLMSAKPRRLSQEASRVVRAKRLRGICYCSRFGREFENWAIFEPWRISDQQSARISADDPDLSDAVHRLGIRSAKA